MDPLSQIACAAAAICLGMMALWGVQSKTKNAAIVDVAWSGSIGLAGVFFAINSAGYFPRRLLAGLMIALWSLRLTAYLYQRVGGLPEEGRYATLREKWGLQANRKFFFFYQLQAVAALLFAAPVLVASGNSHVPLRGTDYLGLLCWAVGLGGVALADLQLAVYRSNPKHQGRTCRNGLWRYSRHPNYFFEWVHWCSYAFLAVNSSFWWVSVAVPLVLLYFIFYVTGIPPTEAQAVLSRGEDYRLYQRTTSTFVPWFPKQNET